MYVVVRVFLSVWMYVLVLEFLLSLGTEFCSFYYGWTWEPIEEENQEYRHSPSSFVISTKTLNHNSGAKQFEASCNVSFFCHERNSTGLQ